jgi:triphosphoribosyl-dephospho-CoA synthase
MSDTPLTIGQLAQTACVWEVMARKAGNVCPGREFPDLTVDDFLKSAGAIAPVLDEAPHHPLGVTILRCIEETRKVVNTNTNLGIVLLLAPLASVPLDQPLEQGIAQLLARTTVEDARNVYAAIRLAKPGGLGEVKEQDVHHEPTLPLREVMALAKDRDLIARQYVTDFKAIKNVTSKLARLVTQYGNLERAIVEIQLDLLGRVGDDLIRRKLGEKECGYKNRALQVASNMNTPHGPQDFNRFDAFLRADNHQRNPGTTADLIAASLFVALREKQIALDTPFVWDQHPFDVVT